MRTRGTLTLTLTLTATRKAAIGAAAVALAACSPAPRTGVSSTPGAASVSPSTSAPTSAASAPAGSVQDVTLLVGRERRYLLFVPEHVASPAALVVSLHGGGGTADGVEKQTGWSRLARAKGFVVAFPDGIGKSWNDGRADTPSPAVRQDVDDVSFLAAVIADAEKRTTIDPKRVFVNGISNGAFMSSRFACERADLVSAIGLVAGTVGPGVLAACKPARPVAVIAFDGTSDPIVPFGGGTVRIGPLVRGAAASVADSVALWVRVDGCTGAPIVTRLPDRDPDDGSTAHLDAYDACSAGKAVHLYTIEGGGHTWPGGLPYLPARIVGRVNRDVDATERMWEFFSSH